MVGRFWRWLTDAHRHDWEILREQDYIHWVRYDGGEKLKNGEGTLYTMRCKTCGEVTTRKAGI